MTPRKTSARRPTPGTKDRILKAAISLFSTKGFDGVSVNDIVEKAGVNKRMVYHYFDNKAGLYQETLLYAYTELEEFEIGAIGDTTALEEIVRRLVRVYFEFPLLHPEFTRLMLWENLKKGQGIKRSRVRLSKDAVVTKLDDAISRDADGVKWRGDLDARMLLITIIGICQVYASHRYTLSQGLHIDLGAAETIKSGMATAEHFLLAGMRPASGLP